MRKGVRRLPFLKCAERIADAALAEACEGRPLAGQAPSLKGPPAHVQPSRKLFFIEKDERRRPLIGYRYAGFSAMRGTPTPSAHGRLAHIKDDARGRARTIPRFASRRLVGRPVMPRTRPRFRFRWTGGLLQTRTKGTPPPIGRPHLFSYPPRPSCQKGQYDLVDRLKRRGAAAQRHWLRVRQAQSV